MKALATDLAALRGSLLLFVVLCILGASTMVAARRIAADAETENRTALAQRTDLRTQRQRIDAEAATIRAYRDRYQALQARGIVGAERRQEWIKHLAASGMAHGLGNVRYELVPGKSGPLPAAVATGGGGGGGEFMCSNMKLQMQLLHEDKLLGFLTALAHTVPALPRVRSCNLERIAGAGSEAKLQLQADCSIDWITLRERP